jgi:glycosyltransferase involved in cell wall biosynthesis
MKICIVTHKLLLTDGQGRINYEVARHLAADGHSITLVATEVDPVLAAVPNIEWRPVRIPRAVPTALLKQQIFAAGAWAALSPDHHSFDIVQLNGAITYLPADVNIAMFVHSNWAKSAYHPGAVQKGSYGAYQRLYTALNAAWERRAFRAATRVVALSPPVSQSLQQDVGLQAGQIKTIEPGVDADEFRPLRKGEVNFLRQAANLSPDKFLLFFAGDIRSNRKNLDLVLNVMTELDKSVHLAVAGSKIGSPYPALAHKLGLADRVHFLGHRPDMAALLRGADAFVFPSHYDTFALVVTEAMASGVATITSNNVGAATMINHGQTGFVLRHSNDHQGLLSTLRRLRDEPGLCTGIAAAGREAAAAYSWRAMAGRYESLYGTLAQAKTRRKAKPPVAAIFN